MELPVIIIFLGGLIFFSHFANGIFDRTKIPNVLLLLLVGIILGPVSGVVRPDFFGGAGKVFTSITLIVILFECGANLKFEELKKAIGRAFLFSLLNFIITMAIGSVLVNYLTRLDWMSSLFTGAVIGGTSSAVVIPMVKQLKIGANSQIILYLESVLTDIFCLVVALAMLEGIKMGIVQPGAIVTGIGKTFLFAVIIGLGAGLVWSFVLRIIRSLENSIFITPAFVFILYGIVEYLGFSGGIAAICFGIIIANNEFLLNSKLTRSIFKIKSTTFNKNEKQFFSEIVFILQTYFFVYIGICIQIAAFSTYLISLLIIGLVIIARAPITKLVFKKGTPARDVTISSIMMPKGLVAAVLASLPLQMEIENGALIQDIGYSVVFFSILICSVLVILLSKDPLIFKRILRKEKIGNVEEQREKSSVEEDENIKAVKENSKD